MASAPAIASAPVRARDRIAHSLRSTELGTGAAGLQALGPLPRRAEGIHHLRSGDLRIDDYLQHGNSDARQVVHEVMAGSPWDREEFVPLVQWMRDHNRQRPERRASWAPARTERLTTTGPGRPGHRQRSGCA
ncbi:erythromycin esterase family protein [Streptomyces violascens]|uniref:erythromycin esterase family protein n=1 Tax=Streptomyces violascens TaxID=67381 RepID=UPI003663F1AE